MARYGKKAQAKVKEVMEEFKAGTLERGRSGKKVTSRKQAVAIGLSEARDAGAKVPPAPAAKKKGKKTAAKKSKSAPQRAATKSDNKASKKSSKKAR